ncbi:hypothetical protein [Embleya hyalina]|uniref:hypothetical protein n=1 Tax=Embleya hyalina TaxID=516124 RepID=UPI000F840D28|nr:hypothetical protein [Embleya hyalina]
MDGSHRSTGGDAGDPGYDDTPFTYRGHGDADVFFDVPVPGESTLLQIVGPSGERLRLWRIERPGGPVGGCVYNGPAEGADGSILIPASAKGRGAPHGVRVRCDGPWSLQLKEPDAAREFERGIEGRGSEVVRYTGPVGLGCLTGTRAGDAVDVRVVPPPAGPIRDELPRQVREFRVAGACTMVVTAPGPWRMRVEPTPPIRPDLPEGTFVLHGAGELSAVVPVTHASESSVLRIDWVSGPELTVQCGEYRYPYGPTYRLGPDHPSRRFRLGPELWARGVPVRIHDPAGEWEIRTTSLVPSHGPDDPDCPDGDGFSLLPASIHGTGSGTLTATPTPDGPEPIPSRLDRLRRLLRPRRHAR